MVEISTNSDTFTVSEDYAALVTAIQDLTKEIRRLVK